MRSVGTALELGMRLCAHPERVTRELHEFDQPTVRRDTRADEPRLFEPRPESRVHLVAVAVALGHDRLPIGIGNLRARYEFGDVCPEAHGPALVCDVLLVA